MIKLLFLLILIQPVFLAENTFNTEFLSQFEKKTEVEVLICKSNNAYAYHKYKCAGLKRCKAKIEEVSINKAKESGYKKACSYCYKN